MNYRKAAVGGTFDHFHVGHEQLLDTAFKVADRVVVGVTSSQLIQTKPFSFSIEPYPSRLQSVIDYCRLKNQDFEPAKLFDSYGPTITDNLIDVLVVSKQTQDGAILVNRKRSSLGMATLPVVVTSMVSDEAGEYISSTAIRSGKITRSGKVFNKLFAQNISFSPSQLDLLKSPQGLPFNQSKITQSQPVVVVGDMVTQFCLQHQLSFNYAIVDGQTQRKPVFFAYPDLIRLQGHNFSSQINSQIANQILNIDYKNSNQAIYLVDGEEDLLAFVPCLCLPLGSIVLYGQPDSGIVMIEVTETNKMRFAQFIDPFFN